MKKSKILVTVLIALMMAVGFGAAGINTVRANDGGDPVDTGKLLYYVDVGSAGDDFTETLPNTLETFETEAGIALAEDDVDFAGKAYNSNKEQLYGEDSVSKKLWGAKAAYSANKATSISTSGFDRIRFAGSGQSIEYKFEVDDADTALRVTVGLADPWWDGRNMKLAVEGTNKVEIASFKTANKNTAYHCVLEGVKGIAGTADEAGKFFITLTMSANQSGHDPLLARIFVETMNHSTNLYGAGGTTFMAEQIVKPGINPVVRLSDTPATANIEGGRVDLVLSQGSIDAINSAKPFTKVNITGTYGQEEYSGNVNVFPRTMEYFVNVGSQNDYEQAILDELYPTLRNVGAMDKQWAATDPAWGYTSGRSGTIGWEKNSYDQSCRYGSGSDKRLEYGFTVAEENSTYDIYFGANSHWGNGQNRTMRLTVSNIAGGNRTIDFSAVHSSNDVPAHFKADEGVTVSGNDAATANHLTLTFSKVDSEDPIITYIALVETNSTVLNLNGGRFVDGEGDEITLEALQIGDVPSEIWGELPVPVKKGYSFDGWFTDDATFLSEADFDEPVTRTTAFYAKWEANDYYVTFHSNNGKNRTLTQSITFDESETLTAFDDLIVADPDFDFDNCTFAGWAATATGVVAYDDEDPYTMTEEGADLYAVWDGDPCDITLDYEGGTPDISDVTGGEITVDYGAYITDLPEDPSLDYHDFAGWFTQAGGQGTEYQNGDQWLEGGAATTLYAHYTPKSYPVNFTLNGGTLSVTPPAEYTYGTGLVTLPGPSRSGYQFLGWCKANGNIATKVESVGTAEFGVITLYALWQEEAYNINYSLNGGSLPAGYAETYTYGTGLSALAQPTRAGYSFGGWFNNAGLTGSPVTAISSTSTGEVSLFAKWIGDEIEITLNLQSGSLPSGASNTLVTEFGAAISGLPVPTRSGYDFAGWYTQAAGQGKKYSDGDISDFAEGAALYAHWTVKSYTVTFNSQEGGAVQSESVNHNAFATKPADPTREGYTFGGWYTDAECTEEWIFDFDKVTSDKTLYAKWTKDSAGGGGRNCGTIGVSGGNSFPTGIILIVTALFFLGLIVLRRPGITKSK